MTEELKLREKIIAKRREQVERRQGLTWTQDKGWSDPHAVRLQDILGNALRLRREGYDTRNAVYESAVNGEADSAAMLAIRRLLACPECGVEQADNGLLAWCANGHTQNIGKHDPRYSERMKFSLAEQQ